MGANTQQFISEVDRPIKESRLTRKKLTKQQIGSTIKAFDMVQAISLKGGETA